MLDTTTATAKGAYGKGAYGKGAYGKGAYGKGAIDNSCNEYIYILSASNYL
jgi:hypothetical protein